jgi:hypothetical protein
MMAAMGADYGSQKHVKLIDECENFEYKKGRLKPSRMLLVDVYVSLRFGWKGRRNNFYEKFLIVRGDLQFIATGNG